MLASKRYEEFQILGSEGETVAKFEGALLAQKCLPGDSVRAVADGGCELVERAEHPPLVGVLEFQSKIKYGYSSRNIPIYRFAPFDTSYPYFLVGSKERHDTNHIAVVRFEDWKETTFPKASLQEILGPCATDSVELEALALQYSPWTWTKRRCPEKIVCPDLSGREVISAMTINIDPPGCRDIDDVLSIWSGEEPGQWKIAISISDVAAYVALNPQLKFAERIGQTLYDTVGYAVRPMFEKGITERLLSLNPDKVARPAISLFAMWDGFRLSDFEWKETVVSTTKSYTYENCQSYPFVKQLQVIAESILGYPTGDSHKWIEALMLLYNSKAAEILAANRQGLLRIHSAPEIARLERYRELGLPAEELAYPAATYCSAAADGASAAGHWGLKYQTYCHASSPIRRYADCVNQAVLKAAIHGETVNVESEVLAYKLNTLSKAAKKYERDLFLAQKILSADGQTLLEGIIVDVGKVYVYDWRRIVSVEDAIIPGTEVNVDYYVNMNQRNWKLRILFSLR